MSEIKMQKILRELQYSRRYNPEKVKELEEKYVKSWNFRTRLYKDYNYEYSELEKILAQK